MNPRPYKGSDLGAPHQSKAAPHQSKAPPSEVLEVRGAPSIQDPTLELQDLKKF